MRKSHQGQQKPTRARRRMLGEILDSLPNRAKGLNPILTMILQDDTLPELKLPDETAEDPPPTPEAGPSHK